MILYKIGDSMKLNNKGFAFSTMLYGCIALIAAVLYIILNTNKNSVDTTYYYGEELLQDLNDCVTEEIALENCYSSGSTTCNPAAYHACLGISDGNASDKGVIISETLKEKQTEAENQNPATTTGLMLDPYNTFGTRYIYSGMEPKNYLSFSDKLWRIVSIERDGSLLLIDTNKYATVEWDKDAKFEWDESSLYYSLNNSYITTITDVSKIVNGTWYLSQIYPSLAASTFNMIDLVSQETDGEFVSAKVGLLSLSDYMNATTSATCHNAVLASSTKDCNSWLTQYKGWVLDVLAETDPSDPDGYAYYFGDKSGQSNKPLYDKTNVTHDVYPAVIINRNSVLKGGSGTLADPYVLK